MKKITIIDYGCGNLLSIKRAIEKVGFKASVSRNLSELKESTHLILPGVGAFGNAINSLDKLNLIEIIKDHSLKKKPLLGICLGMQLLLSSSYEFGFFKGLDIIEGTVEKITSSKKNKIKIPHIGWNTLIFKNKKNNLNIDKKSSFYFIHSYLANVKKKSSIIAYADFENIKIPAIIQENKVLGVQFHPEKSSFCGLKLLRQFCNYE